MGGLCAFPVVWPEVKLWWGNGDLLHKDLWCMDLRTVVVSASDPAAGHCWPTPPLETPRHSQGSLIQFLVGSLLLSPGFWCTKALLYLPRTCFPGSSQCFCWISKLGNLLWALELLQQCENFFGIIVLQFVSRLLSHSIVVLKATSFKRTLVPCRTSQVCCSQSPCPCGQSLVTSASTGGTQTLKGQSGSVSFGSHCSFRWPWCVQGFLCTSEHLAGLRFNFKPDCTHPTILLGLLLCNRKWGVPFGWAPTFSCWSLSSS